MPLYKFKKKKLFKFWISKYFNRSIIKQINSLYYYKSLLAIDNQKQNRAKTNKQIGRDSSYLGKCRLYRVNQSNEENQIGLFFFLFSSF